jgi:hypothetical protein
MRVEKDSEESGIIGYKSRLSYGMLKKTARAIDIANVGAWVAARAMCSGPQGTLSGMFLGYNSSNAALRYIHDRKDDPKHPTFDKYESGFWAVVGAVNTGAAVYDALSGRFENVPGDVAFAAASYMEAASKSLHRLADMRKDAKW